MKRQISVRCRRGYSLIEMLVVVGLMAVVGAFAASNHLGQRPSRLLERATMQIASDLCSARMQAVSVCEPVVVTFSEDGRGYTFWTDYNTNGVSEVSETQSFDVDVPGLQFKSTAPSSTFSPRGTLGSADHYWACSLTVAEAGTRHIYVLPNGQVRCSKNAIVWGDGDDDA